MDMKKILAAIDGASAPRAVADNDMRRFVSIIRDESARSAESIQLESVTAPRKSITSPVLNADKDARPSMIGKYFRSVEKEFDESDQRFKDRSSRLAEMVSKKITERVSIESDRKILGVLPLGQQESIHEETEGVDSVTLDIPLLIRLLEFAREDAGDDMTLHQIAEKMIGMKEEGQSLSMSDYDDIVGENSLDEACWKTHKQIGMKKKGKRIVPNCVPKK